MFFIENDGQAVARTNFWESEFALAGLFTLSWNAGAARLLMPACQTSMLKEMRSASYVIISCGFWLEQGVRDGFELLFEDHSDNPFCLHFSNGQILNFPVEARRFDGFDLTVWTQDGKEMSTPGKYRKVDIIPCLESWNEN